MTELVFLKMRLIQEAQLLWFGQFLSLLLFAFGFGRS
jgi:hypothetical protein